jgi:signal transduction histidine kinase
VLSSLRLRLLAPVLVALLPALGVLGYATLAQRRLLVGDARSEADQLARLVAEVLQRPIDGARGLLLGLAHLPTVLDQDPACGAQVARLLRQEPAYLNMGAIDPQGKVYCSARPLPGAVHLSDRRFFQRALASRDFGVGEFVVSRIVGQASLGFGQAVLDDAGSLRAVAFASLDVAWLQQRLDALAVPEGASVEVLDRLGVVITSRGHPERAGLPFDPSLLSALARAGAPVEAPGPDKVQRLHALHSVADRGGEPIIQVVVGLPAEVVLGPVNRITVLSLAAFGLVTILALLAAGWAGEVLLVRKLKVVIGAARRLSGGDIGTRTNLRAGRGEFGDLIRAFDEMAASLQRQMAERTQLEEELRHSQKMEAVGRLAGGVAHDFNNLLTAVLSGARMIESDLPADHASRQDVAEIIKAGERAAALTGQLLTFSRRQRVAPRVVALADVVQGLAKLLRRTLGETIKLEVVANARGVVLADPGQLEQVIVNLAVNARDAMPEGGRLTITVDELERTEREPSLETGMPVGPLVVLTVEDTGTGMDLGTQARIFEPFFTTKGPGKGTGLGLSTVYGIVTQSGGAVRVRSTPGAGTAFRVCLPRHEGPSQEMTPPVPRTRVRGGHETILLVEDDDAVRSIARRILEQGGYTVLEAAGPRAAVALAEDPGRSIDLLLTDVLLPDENGPALARRLSALRPGLRVAFMSGDTGESHEADFPPAAPFLGKPFTPDSLLSTVRQALDG